MARHAHEFSCTNCSYWNYPMLSDSMNGNYVIKCGNCGHDHYRNIKDGKVTETRHNKGSNNLQRVHVMKSATFKEKKKLGVVAQMRGRLFADSMGGSA